MNTSILELPITEPTHLEQNDIPDILDETGKSLPAKRFGIVDLWNIREKRKHFTVYGRHI